MNWLIDLGNTRLKCAALSASGERGVVQHFTHRDDQESTITTLLSFLSKPAAQANIWLASVASIDLTERLIDVLQSHQFIVHRVHSAAQFGKLRIGYVDPLRLGVDRFLSLIAACQRHDGPWMLVSAGSALTVDVLDAQHRHLGGLIAPTPTHMREALAMRFPVFNGSEGVVCDFADDTATAIASGTYAAAIGLVEHSLSMAHEKLAAWPTLLLTGGGLSVFDKLNYTAVVRAPALVLDGLAIFAQTIDH